MVHRTSNRSFDCVLFFANQQFDDSMRLLLDACLPRKENKSFATTIVPLFLADAYLLFRLSACGPTAHLSAL
jgi:hypothetical protein